MTDRPGRVFICYRREDTRHVAGRLADRLEDRLGATQVFMDINTLEPGDDFALAIQTAVSTCDACVVLIGPSWLAVTDRRGRRRLEDPHDFVVLEVTTALEHGIRVIPVLVDGADMPRADELPPALRPLSRRHAVRIDHESFRTDVAPLLRWLERPPTPAPAAAAAAPKPEGSEPFGVDRETSRGTPRTVTADDVHRIRFSKPPIGKRGYNEDEVDAYLDLVEKTLRDPRSTKLTPADVRNVAFSKPPIGKRGYEEEEVDTFLDLVENTVRVLRDTTPG